MMDEAIRSRLQDNWARVQEEVWQAAEDCGRARESVTIVGVSKYVDAGTTKALFDVGCIHLGESRPQALWEKSEQMSDLDGLHWHLIGHLQRNKVRRTLACDLPLLIHSIDSERLLDALATESSKRADSVTVLLEVNISGDEAKTGMSRDQLRRIIDRLPLPGIEIDGLMAMAGWGTDAVDARRQFEQVRQLRDQLESDTSVSLSTLSMGMSGDFPQAIAAGATHVRIGSRLFDGIR